MARAYTLSGKAVREQKRINRIVRGGFRRRRPPERRPRFPGSGTPKLAALAKTDAGGVPPATENAGTFTPGVGGAMMYVLDDSGGAQWEEGDAITIYNSVPNESVSGDKIVQLKKIDGYWFVDVEPCDGS